jgi:transcriptional regulator with XRE-family HTH domain
MPSPYVRRRRLAAELRKIREQQGMTAEQLGQRVFQSRTKITRMELGQVRPDLAEIMKILEALGVEGTKYDRLFQLAREAAEKGWWDRYGVAMGPRQKIYADLEYSAKSVKDYNQTAMPVVLQSPVFISALVELDRLRGPLNYEPQRMTQARQRRQEELLRPDGPSYETVLDECVIHRLGIPRAVMAEQLQHMVELVSSEERIAVRVLPYNAYIPGGFLPKSSFYIFTFPDPRDSTLVVLETMTTDMVLSQKSEVMEYTDAYDRLSRAALSRDDSLIFLRGVADRLAKEAGSEA